MTQTQLIYSSRPFGYDTAILSGILLDARRCNNRDGITGALVCRHDIFLQLLEGPSDMIEATYARIARDDRHLNMLRHTHDPIETRMFGEWDMLHDPAKSWLWSIEDVTKGAVARASEDEVRAIFTNLADNVRACV